MIRTDSQPTKASFLQPIMMSQQLVFLEDNSGFQDCYRKVHSTIKFKIAGTHLPSAWVTLTPLWQPESELVPFPIPRNIFCTRWDVKAGICQQWSPWRDGSKKVEEKRGSGHQQGCPYGMIT